MSTPEGKVKETIRRAIARLVYPGTTRPAAFPFMPVQCGFGGVGLDWFLCINRLFVAIEAKAKGKKPTDRQETTMSRIREAGGLTFVIDDMASLAEVMAQICNTCHVEYGPPEKL